MSGLLNLQNGPQELDLNNPQIGVAQAWASALGQPNAFGQQQQQAGPSPMHWNGSSWVNAVTGAPVASSAPQQAMPAATPGAAAPMQQGQAAPAWNAGSGGLHWNGSQWQSPTPAASSSATAPGLSQAVQYLMQQSMAAQAQQKAADDLASRGGGAGPDGG
jgi:hypothetical protein